MWKTIESHPNYEVSMWGEVRNQKTGRILSTSPNDKGYPRVELWSHNKRTRKLVHKLVAEAFLPNPENKEIVNHKDCNKENPNVGNLEWATQLENMLHAKQMMVYNNQTSVVQYTLEGEYVKTFYSLTDAGLFVGGNGATLKRNLEKGKPYKNYMWRWK